MLNKILLCILLYTSIQIPIYAETCTPLYTPSPEQDQFLDDLEHRIFNYFWTEVFPETGIAVDHTQNRIGKVAATGFELSAVIIGIKRGWITYDEGYQRTFLILNSFYKDPKDPKDAYVDGKFGLFWHFVKGNTGRLEPVDCVAMCDSGDFIGGVVLDAEFFKGTPAGDLAQKIYDEVEWNKFVDMGKDGKPGLLSFGWVPLHVSKSYYDVNGLLTFDMSGFSDNSLLIYVLALGSDTHRIPQETWEKYVDTYTLDEYAGYEAVMSSALYSRQVPHSFINFNRKRDRKIDYFLEIVNKILADRAFNIKENGYPPELWGLTDCFGKNSYSHGAPPGQVQNDGTVGSTAFVSALPFVPKESFEAMKYVKEKFGEQAYGKYGFTSSVNLKNNYVSPLYVGIETGPMIMMIENYRSGLIWDLFSQSKVMKNFIKRAKISGVVDDFELPPEAAQYAAWKVTGGEGRIGGDDPQHGHKCFEFISSGGPVTIEGTLTENDLMKFDYDHYLSLWARDLKVLDCNITIDGKTLPLKHSSKLDGIGWEHHYFRIPWQGRSSSVCGISVRCEVAGKDAALDNISFEAEMDKLPPDRIRDLRAATGKFGGAISLQWPAPQDKDGDNVAQYIVRIADDPNITNPRFMELLPACQFPSKENRMLLTGGSNPLFVSLAAVDEHGHISEFSPTVKVVPNPNPIDRTAFKCSKQDPSSIIVSNAQWSLTEADDKEKGKCISVEYVKTGAWDHIAIPLDPAMVAVHRYLLVTVKGNVEILGKLWCRDDFQFDMERQESLKDDEWTVMKFDTFKAGQIKTGRDAVKRLILFPAPGKWTGKGSFLIDRVEYSN